MAARYAVADYVAALRALFPRGRAWRFEPGSVQAALLDGLAPSLARTDAAAQALLVDAFPPTAMGLLPEWESTMGLPDPCQGLAPSIASRQAQVAARLTFPGGQSARFFEAFAQLLGFDIQITEFVPFRAGQGRIGDLVADDTWAFVWRIDVDSDVHQPVLECELRALQPAHTLLYFQYGRDLTSEDGLEITAEDGAVLTT